MKQKRRPAGVFPPNAGVSPNAEKPGLVLIGTPLGNLGDFSPRAAQTLAAADRIAAEDSRVAARLLHQLGIETDAPLISYHAHNERSREDTLLAYLEAGERVALVTDAGMPCISDPGFELVETCVEKGYRVSVVPGPSAVTTLLAASALDSRRFVFEGFLPRKPGDRRRRLAAIRAEERTVVLYEAPHRLQKLLEELLGLGLGERRLTVGREMTKAYEEFRYGSVASEAAYFAETAPRGEFALALEGGEAFRYRRADALAAKEGINRVQALRRLEAEGTGEDL